MYVCVCVCVCVCDNFSRHTKMAFGSFELDVKTNTVAAVVYYHGWGYG